MIVHLVWIVKNRKLGLNVFSTTSLVLIGLAILGTAIGITGGLSRVGVVGELMAGVLGVLGAVVVWIFTEKQEKGVAVSLCAIAFTVSLFTGYIEAASRRAYPESYDFWRNKCVAIYTDKDTFADPIVATVVDSSLGTICAQIFNNEKEQLTSK